MIGMVRKGMQAIRVVYRGSFGKKSERCAVALVGQLTYGPHVTDHELFQASAPMRL